MPSKSIFHHLLALLVVAIWGVTFISTKVLINNGLQPSQIFVIRFVMAYAGIWVLQALGKEKTRLLSRSLRDEAVFLFLGVSGGSMYFLAENTALAYTQASNTAFIVSTAPLLTILLTLAFRKMFKGEFAAALEPVRVNWALVLGTLLALGGVAMIAFDGSRFQMSLRGDLLAFAAALCWGLYSIFMGKMSADYGEVFATRKVFFYGLLTIVPFILAGDGMPSAEVLGRGPVILNLLFLGLVASLACFIIWNKVIVSLGNVSATNYVYLNPFFTLVTAIVVLGERLTPLSAAGSLAIFAGVFLAGRYKETKKVNI